MRRVLRTLVPMALLWGTAVAQPVPQPVPKTPEFEAADVHVSAPGGTESGGFLPNGRAEFRSLSLLRLITIAYSVQADRVVGGPNWLDSDRFDVTAKAHSTSASQAVLRTMLQGLLAERFKLALKSEEKPMPVFALVPGKRGVNKDSSGSEDPECKGDVQDNLRTYTCHNVTIESLAERLPLVAPGYFNRPVIDRSGVKGAFDFKLEWLPRGQLTPGSESGSLFSSIEKQLGVKVEAQTAPMAALTIEHVERTPVPNPPGVTEKLGAPPTEFEVANIKRSRPDEQPDANINGGRVDAKALSLKELIAFAYDVEEDWVKGGEKWLDSERFDILAKSVPTASADTLRGMLQALLAERFHLKVHKESQPVAVYALTAGKPKLKEADPSARATCKTSAADGARTMTCQNTTMAAFAEKIRPAAVGYLDHVVVDLTGLKGGYDFAVSWSPRGRLLGAGGRGGDNPAAAGGGVPAAEDRPVGFTIFEAVDRQLGLKLAAQKHPMPVIVVDHVDRTPTEN